MYPFWDDVIEPVIKAVRGTRIVEIGALRGDTTIRMLEDLGPDAELHVIDPVPEFDPSEHEREFPGRYIFHRDLSLNVLPNLEPVDVALIDGDHNWYTVYNELKQLAGVASAAGAPMPVMIMHDVGWPYGRRDLYYAPEQIPEEFRQPYDQRGMGQNRSKLMPEGRGGLNPRMNNALNEGGPRNGVMTALDDFVDECDKPLRIVVIPVYFGLAIVVEQERLDRQPELAALLDWVESDDGLKRMMELGEFMRLKAMMFQHKVYYESVEYLENAAQRYLDLLERSLLDDLYLDNELRIDHLVDCIENARKPNAKKLQDPRRHMKDEARRAQAERDSGRFGDLSSDLPAYFPYTTMGRQRLRHLGAALKEVRNESTVGDLVECGTGRGGGAIYMRGFLDAYGETDRSVFVADRFQSSAGTSQTSSALPGGGRGFPDFLPDLNAVRDGFENFGLLDDRVRFLQGPYSETLDDAPITQIALLRVGAADGADVAAVLDALYDKVSIGGHVIVDRTDDAEVARAVDEFRARRGIAEPLQRTSWGDSSWRKQMEAPAKLKRRERKKRPAAAPLAPPPPDGPIDLSVVVVFYNMKREAARTLHSLSRTYQRDIEDLDYEVLVLENGSSEELKLSEEFVSSFGPEFRFIDMGPEAEPSPVPALNRGLKEARGDAIALMIDGAHVLTPGVLHWGMEGLRSFGTAIVTTQQWYVGPGQQPEMMTHGYDQALEDTLFEKINWPTDGYRLFDIGSFIGDRDWFDGIWESNCMFVPRKLLEQVGGFDESFSVPGGGYANLELYERLGSSPDVTVATLLGEGSFHQVHGGTTTNRTAADERHQEIASYADQYNEMRGKSFRGPGKPIHYIGRLFPSARRTRARYRVAPELVDLGIQDLDAIPDEPMPLPDELRTQFVDAYWHNLAWQKTSWLGHEIPRPPTDLFAYQEIVSEVQPDWIVETGADLGGARALFLASICELVGHGQVLSIGPAGGDTADHPRITRLQANSVVDATIDKVRQIVGSSSALVILGARSRRQRVLKEFEAYSPLVPVGSYVIIEDTILGGHPVWPGFGTGPAEAAKAIVNERGEFAVDPTMEKHGLTFSPAGYLKRVG